MKWARTLILLVVVAIYPDSTTVCLLVDKLCHFINEMTVTFPLGCFITGVVIWIIVVIDEMINPFI